MLMTRVLHPELRSSLSMRRKLLLRMLLPRGHASRWWRIMPWGWQQAPCGVCSFLHPPFLFLKPSIPLPPSPCPSPSLAHGDVLLHSPDLQPSPHVPYPSSRPSQLSQQPAFPVRPRSSPPVWPAASAPPAPPPCSARSRCASVWPPEPAVQIFQDVASFGVAGRGPHSPPRHHDPPNASKRRPEQAAQVPTGSLNSRRYLVRPLSRRGPAGR
mmetsp:Transcript_22404/g.47741  ORF Transcript_22404/g.47741 Transcript_22404/m.47741 type:complete len:213 (-) Transcript_22404:260-898(-)